MIWRKTTRRESQNLLSLSEHRAPAASRALLSVCQHWHMANTHSHTHTQTCTRMHVHAVTISGSGVLEFGRRLIMSECHIFMHECAVFMHADLVTFADMQTHTHTYTYTERQQMCSACIHKQPSDQTLSYIRGKFEVSWTDKCCRTAVAPFLLHGSFRGSRAAWFFRKSRQNYWQSTA